MPGGPHVRVDTHITAGDSVPRNYDSLLAKLVVHTNTRAEAIRAMQAALSEMRVDGVLTNQSLHQRILDDARFREGGISIHHLETQLAHWRTRISERLDDRRIG
jgi:acetyl-CoA carboxylase biotin carboxylase subunit